jgi:hypothetical protein
MAVELPVCPPAPVTNVVEGPAAGPADMLVELPPALTTVTGLEPPPGGLVATISLALMIVKPVAGAAPKKTAVVGSARFEP